jgi:hypothetical protein
MISKVEPGFFLYTTVPEQYRESIFSKSQQVIPADAHDYVC